MKYMDEVKKESPHRYIVLKKMCDMVKAPYSVVNSCEDWYHKYSWTQKQEDEFKKWFADYLYNNTEARNEIMSMPIKRKKVINGVVEFWNLDYGWKIKEESK
jgi:hypothetical protein